MNVRRLELLAAGIVGAAWILASRSIPALPERIPTHFGLNGVADATGPASSIWYLPVALSVMYVFLSALQFVPAGLMNYPVPISQRNRAGVYALGREMLAAIKVCTLLTFLAIEWGCIDAARRGSPGPLFVVLIFTPVIVLLGLTLYYVSRMRAI